jgi:hypothetical protein
MNAKSVARHWRVWGAGAILAIAAAVAAYLVVPRDPWPPKPDTSAANRYYTTEFKPRFRRADCIVRLDYIYRGPAKWDGGGLIFRELIYYLFTYEPKAAVFAYQGKDMPGEPGSAAMFVQYADLCDRRVEITEAFARYMRRRHGDWYRIHVRHERIEPGPETIDTTGPAWIDVKAR